MEAADDGFVSLGIDCVFRSYAGNGSVIDYRQLDPEQVAAEIASPNHTLPSSAYGDGRLVTNLGQFLQLWHL